MDIIDMEHTWIAGYGAGFPFFQEVKNHEICGKAKISMLFLMRSIANQPSKRTQI